MSREVIERLGWWNLADPALFQAMAMSRGVDIVDMASVDVIYTNKVRPVHTGTTLVLLIRKRLVVLWVIICVLCNT